MNRRIEQRLEDLRFYHQACEALLPLAKRCNGTIIAGFDTGLYSVCFSRFGVYVYTSRKHTTPDAAVVDMQAWLQEEYRKLKALRDVLVTPGKH